MSKTSRVFRWTLAIAIVIVLNLFFNFAIKLIYKAPIYETFCAVQQVHVPPTTQKACLDVGGQWNENSYNGQPVKIVSPNGDTMNQPAGYCDEQFTCRKNFDDSSRIYNRNVFIALVVLGTIALFAGFYLGASTPVSSGLSLGGVLSFIIGSIRYWSDMDDYLRVVILGLALVALIWLGIKKFSE